MFAEERNMKKYRYFILLLITVIVYASCSKKDQPPRNSVIKPSESAKSFSRQQGSRPPFMLELRNNYLLVDRETGVVELKSSIVDEQTLQPSVVNHIFLYMPDCVFSPENLGICSFICKEALDSVH